MTQAEGGLRAGLATPGSTVSPDGHAGGGGPQLDRPRVPDHGPDSVTRLAMPAISAGLTCARCHAALGP
eukprot:13030418-Alexandrium_andersonii.AAC.2